MNYPIPAIFGLVSVFVLGCCWGSFLNVCIWRMPRGESVVFAPSHCTSCGAEIRWFDNLPLVSYLVLRGRCRHCHAPYSCRYFIVELITGILFVAAFAKIGMAEMPPAALLTAFAVIMLALPTVWIDFEHRIIPDALTLPALLFALVVSVVFPDVCAAATHLQGLLAALLPALIVGGGLWCFAVTGRRLAGREVLGLGDVKFMAAIAALYGLPGAFFVLGAGSLGGVVYGLVMAARRKRSPHRIALPLGPFLALAALIWLWVGDWLLAAYLRHIGIAF